MSTHKTHPSGTAVPAQGAPMTQYDDALEVWRTAAELVRDRWHEFRAAGRESRPLLFAAYVAALDQEEAAAGALALLTVELAA